MTPEETQQAEQDALAPALHTYRMGIETLIFAYLAQTGLGLNKFDINTKTVNNVIHTWVSPKVTA
jgi:hypothetical protein